MNNRKMQQNEIRSVFIAIPLLFFFTALQLEGYSQQLTGSVVLPECFSDKAFQHIEVLVKNGPRQAGSENEVIAADYIRKQFECIGLKTGIEFFEYESFEFTDLDLVVNNIHFSPAGLGFTPYRGITYYEGDAVLINSDTDIEDLDPGFIAGKTIISDDYTSHFQLIRYQPDLIIYVDSADFDILKLNDKISYSLKIEGHYRKFKSPNVTGRLGDTIPQSKEIIIGAHLDSYRTSPGASDNGSGVGVLIELARYFKEIENGFLGSIRFVAFGAEEIGILGSRRYIQMHPEITDNCGLFFNIDDVGGSGSGMIQVLGGVSELPEILKDSLSERLSSQPWEGVTSLWRAMPDEYLMNYITTVNHPDWFVDLVENSILATGYNIARAGSPGADEMSFSRLGIVSSSICIQGTGTHTPGDTTDIINMESLRKAGEITASVVLRTLDILNVSDYGER